jgi:hypothetical protein
MALHSNPPHAVDTYTVASGTDAGGGVQLTYTLAQSAVPCSINTSSSSEQERFSQQQQTVTHTVAFLTATLTTSLTRGMKLVTSDRSESFHVHGISHGRAYGTIPAFTYAYCESLN